MRNESKTGQTDVAREGHSTNGPPGGKLIFYRSPDGKVLLDIKLEKETVWLSQKQMALLFGKDADTIGLHIRNAFKEKELDEQATTEESSVVQQESTRL